MRISLSPDGISIVGKRANNESTRLLTNQAEEWLLSDSSPEALAEKIGDEETIIVVMCADSKMHTQMSPEVVGFSYVVREISKQAFVDAVTREASELDSSNLDDDSMRLAWVSPFRDDSVVRFVGANPPEKPATLDGHPKFGAILGKLLRIDKGCNQRMMVDIFGSEELGRTIMAFVSSNVNSSKTEDQLTTRLCTEEVAKGSSKRQSVMNLVLFEIYNKSEIREYQNIIYTDAWEYVISDVLFREAGSIAPSVEDINEIMHDLRCNEEQYDCNSFHRRNGKRQEMLASHHIRKYTKMLLERVNS